MPEIRGKDAEAIRREIAEGTPNTPERTAFIREADAVYKRGRDMSANDLMRMDFLQRWFVGADFQWGDLPQPVIVIALPADAKVGADLRETVDRMIAARNREPHYPTQDSPRG